MNFPDRLLEAFYQIGPKIVTIFNADRKAKHAIAHVFAKARCGFRPVFIS